VSVVLSWFFSFSIGLIKFLDQYIFFCSTFLGSGPILTTLLHGYFYFFLPFILTSIWIVDRLHKCIESVLSLLFLNMRRFSLLLDSFRLLTFGFSFSLFVFLLCCGSTFFMGYFLNVIFKNIINRIVGWHGKGSSLTLVRLCFVINSR
jgi:hypothetical protein